MHITFLSEIEIVGTMVTEIVKLRLKTGSSDAVKTVEAKLMKLGIFYLNREKLSKTLHDTCNQIDQ